MSATMAADSHVTKKSDAKAQQRILEQRRATQN
jgi:hypothetical protein